MIISMTSDTLFNVFVHELSEYQLMNATYVLVHNRIHIGSKTSELDNSIHLFEPSAHCRTLIDPRHKPTSLKHNREYIESYYLELQENIVPLATIIRDSILNGRLYVFLNTPSNEKHTAVLKHITDYTFNRFKFLIIPFSDKVCIRDDVFKYDIVRKCTEVIKTDYEYRKNIAARDEALAFHQGKYCYRQYLCSLDFRDVTDKAKYYGIDYDKGDSKQDIANKIATRIFNKKRRMYGD